MIWLFLLLSFSCANLPDGGDASKAGTWMKTRTPPGYEQTYDCWIWQGGIMDQTYGGPVCFPKELR